MCARSTPLTDAEFSSALPLGDMSCRVALNLAYVWGQRISDVIQLGTDDFTWEWFGAKRFTTTVRRGKVIRHIGPYSLSISDGQLARQVATFVGHRRQQGHQFLFTDTNTQPQRDHMGRQIRDLLKLVNPELEQRSIRRGGLTRMARQGVPIAVIRTMFSKHASEPMLMRYLENGRAVYDNAATAAVVTGWAQELDIAFSKGHILARCRVLSTRHLAGMWPLEKTGHASGEELKLPIHVHDPPVRAVDVIERSQIL